jgi:phage/plasmid-associated DNA primase
MPFKFPEARADDTLKDRVLTEEGGKILAWMIDGAGAYLREGERVPTSVQRSVAKYRAEEDTIARYIDTRLILDTDVTTTRQGIYQDYQLWANMNRIFPVLSEPKFARELLATLPDAEIPGNEELFHGIRPTAAAGHHQMGNPYDPLAAVLGY